jgi:hypothetical protein
MDRTRIRWSNLGRLVGGLSAGGLLLFVVPGLVDAPEPPPLASDVGLTSGATGALADAASAPEPVRRRHPRAREGESGRKFADRSRPHRQDPEREREREQGAARTPADRQTEPPVVTPAPPVTPPPPPSPVSSPAPPAPPAAPTPPAPEPEPAPPEPEEPETQPPPAPDPSPPPPAGPSQFGFEH